MHSKRCIKSTKWRQTYAHELHSQVQQSSLPSFGILPAKLDTERSLVALLIESALPYDNNNTWKLEKDQGVGHFDSLFLTNTLLKYPLTKTLANHTYASFYLSLPPSPPPSIYDLLSWISYVTCMSFVCVGRMEESNKAKNPSEFLRQTIGRPVTVKLSSGTEYRGLISLV